MRIGARGLRGRLHRLPGHVKAGRFLRRLLRLFLLHSLRPSPSFTSSVSPCLLSQLVTYSAWMVVARLCADTARIALPHSVVFAYLTLEVLWYDFLALKALPAKLRS